MATELKQLPLPIAPKTNKTGAKTWAEVIQDLTNGSKSVRLTKTPPRTK